MTHIMIVAEIGCNHNGDKNLAYRMIDEAVNAEWTQLNSRRSRHPPSYPNMPQRQSIRK